MPDWLPREIKRAIQLFQSREEVIPIRAVETTQSRFDFGQPLLGLSQQMLHSRNDVFWLDSIKSG